MDSVTTLQCQNLTCLAPNLLTHQFCEKCGTPLVKRYLWMMGDWVQTYYTIGSMIADRYLVKQPGVVLDTKPAQSPQSPDEPPSSIAAYLRLFSQRLHVPQIYGYIPCPDESLESKMDIWLLEYGTIPLDHTGELLYPELLPTLAEMWPKASALEQIHWLWQIARLWQPLQRKNVVSSLLNPSLTRLNGRIVQLLELKMDEPPVPRLKNLGQAWTEWLPSASENIRDFLDSLCQKLCGGDIDRTDALISVLDVALLHYGQAYERTYHLFTCTDTGPAREHNEDACYPEPDRAITLTDAEASLVIVCDGIGGQEGGEIASGLAIETLQQAITPETLNQLGDNPNARTQTLEQAIRNTNDTISERNDSERRKERQRMGTTLVLTLAHAHEMYTAHVGDSRIYWITPQSCHQVTVDDDLASREVRLGYLLYRDAIQYPNAGALVQALGMGSSTNLHPTVQRFVLDKDCVFLLCSDGLSDHDRVEQYWDTEIVPLLTGEKTIAEVGARLLDLANQKNGHDNATIALVHCQVQPVASPVAPLTSADIEAKIRQNSADEIDFEESPDLDSDDDTIAEKPTRIPEPDPIPPPAPVPARSTARSTPLFLLVGAILLGVLGVIGLVGWKILLTPPSNPPIEPSPSPTSSP